MATSIPRRRPAVERLEDRCLLTTVTEFSSGISAGAAPFGITRAADGNLWFAEFGTNALGRITPGGTVTEFSLAALHAVGSPEDVTGGPGGLLYFTLFNQVGSINPLAGGDAAIQGSLKLSAALGGDANLQRIAVGSDGNLWVTEYDSNQVGSVTPDLATLHQYPLPNAGSGPVGITAGPDGALWFTEQNADQFHGAIGRITTAGTVTNEYPVPTVGSGPISITAGPDGNLWFPEAGGIKIGQITPSGTIHEFPLPPGNPLDITTGPDGNLWFTGGGPSEVGRISTAGMAIQYTAGVTATTNHIVTGPDGNLWFTEKGANRVGRLGPDLLALSAPVTAIATVPFSGMVGGFTTSDPRAVAGDFAVTIDWGDGTPPDTTTGTVIDLTIPAGRFGVSGSHTYAQAGSDTIMVTVRDTRFPSGATAFSPATVVPFANSALLGTQELGPSRATAGGTVTYTITLTNSGPADAQAVSLTDDVPDGTTFVAAAQLSGPSFKLTTPPAGGTGTVTADQATLTAGQAATFKVLFRAGATMPVVNTAKVATTTPNRNPAPAVSAPVPVPVQLTLSSAALADYSPAGTTVGTVILTLPVALAGQFLPPIYGLPSAEADNAAFALADGGPGEALVAQFRACSGSQATYQARVHVDVGFGDQAVTLPVTITAAASPCTSPTAAPVLDSVQVVRAGRQGAVQELVLVFGAALDPASAAVPGHYAIDLGSAGKGAKRKAVTVPVLSASYDPVLRTVTLHLGRVKGKSPRGTLTVEGLLGLDGVPGSSAPVTVDLRPKPSHKH